LLIFFSLETNTRVYIWVQFLQLACIVLLNNNVYASRIWNWHKWFWTNSSNNWLSYRCVHLIMCTLNNVQSFFLQGQILKVAKNKSIENSNFNPKRQTKFIIHGFIDTPLSNWVKVSFILLLFQYSFIVLDFYRNPCVMYSQSNCHTHNTNCMYQRLAYIVHLHRPTIVV